MTVILPKIFHQTENILGLQYLRIYMFKNMSRKVVKILLKQSNLIQTGFDFPGVPFHPAVVAIMFWEAKPQILEGGQRESATGESCGYQL